MDERLLASVLATLELAVLRRALFIDATGLDVPPWEVDEADAVLDVNDLVNEFNFELDHKFPIQ